MLVKIYLLFSVTSSVGSVSPCLGMVGRLTNKGPSKVPLASDCLKIEETLGSKRGLFSLIVSRQSSNSPYKAFKVVSSLATFSYL